MTLKNGYMVVRMDHEKDEAEVLFESEERIDCVLFVEDLEDKTDIEISVKY